MRSTTIAVIAALSLAAPSAHAQSLDSGGPQNVLLFNAADLLNGTVTLEFEHAFTRYFGLEFGMSVLAFRGVFDPPVQARVIAVAPEVGVRFHLIRPAPGGLWFGLSVNGAYIAPANDPPPRAFGFGFGAAVGYNFIFGPFVLQLGVGGAVHDYGAGFVWSPHFRVGVGGAF